MTKRKRTYKDLQNITQDRKVSDYVKICDRAQILPLDLFLRFFSILCGIFFSPFYCNMILLNFSYSNARLLLVQATMLTFPFDICRGIFLHLNLKIIKEYNVQQTTIQILILKFCLLQDLFLFHVSKMVPFHAKFHENNIFHIICSKHEFSICYMKLSSEFFSRFKYPQIKLKFIVLSIALARTGIILSSQGK